MRSEDSQRRGLGAAVSLELFCGQPYSSSCRDHPGEALRVKHLCKHFQPTDEPRARPACVGICIYDIHALLLDGWQRCPLCVLG